MCNIDSVYELLVCADGLGVLLCNARVALALYV